MNLHLAPSSFGCQRHRYMQRIAVELHSVGTGRRVAHMAFLPFGRDVTVDWTGASYHARVDRPQGYRYSGMSGVFPFGSLLRRCVRLARAIQRDE